jgi:DHA1 family bicyclomycin/chloramphenicol resistance-like MFS transporter
MTPTTRLSQGEFIALIAMLFATIALSIDAMLPALPEIAATLTPDNPNRAQLVVGAIFLGMGVSTLFVGPLSDAYGRKPVLMASGVVYCIACVICYYSTSFEMLLAGRLLQGIGVGGPRTVSMALVRDLYKGREMARIMSFAMMIFMLVPAVAPLLGQGIIAIADWQTIFLAYIIFCGVALAWLGLRQPETLPPEHRIPLSLATMAAASRDLFARKVILVSIVIQGLVSASLIATISSVQGIFQDSFGRAETFPLWFALIACLAGVGSFINSRVVMKAGMRKVVTVTFAVVLVITLVHLALRLAFVLPEPWTFYLFLGWVVCLFGMMGLTMGNLNALAMEPVGHIAGFAASMIGALSTVLSVIIAAPIGLAFDGTPVPLVAGSAALLAASLALMRFLGPRQG